MLINKKSIPISPKKLLAFCLLACILIAIIVFYVYTHRDSVQKSGNINYRPPTNEQIQAGEDAKKEAIERNETTGGTEPNTTANPVSFTLSQDDGSQTIVVSTKLANTASWEKCYLELRQGQTIKNYEARAVYQPTYSFCGGFSIPTDGMSGTWQVALRANDLSGVSYEKTDFIEIR